MSLSVVFICLALVVGIYFYNNPLKHGPWFLSRRFINWFPLGMTYAFLYMGRYNLTVAKNALGSLMSNEDFGLIFIRHERAERVLRDREIVASHVKERVSHPQREPVNEPPA